MGSSTSRVQARTLETTKTFWHHGAEVWRWFEFAPTSSLCLGVGLEVGRGQGVSLLCQCPAGNQGQFSRLLLPWGQGHVPSLFNKSWDGNSLCSRVHPSLELMFAVFPQFIFPLPFLVL